MRRALAAVLAAAALLVAGCGDDEPRSRTPATEPVPVGFAGIVSEDAFADPGTYRERQFAAQRRAGITLIRQTFAWSAIETEPGRYDLATYDRYVADAARAGLSILPILFDPPAFRSRGVQSSDPRAARPPRSLSSMAAFAVALERRYGRSGTLWSERPELPKRPITAWQIWNEPNLPVYWAGKPDARAYTRMLRTVGEALHRRDPGAEVVTAGLPNSKLGTPFATYLKAMYAAGAAGTFDTLAVNAYSRRVSGMEAAISGARRIMASAGEGDVPIRVTEFGWATRPGPGSALTVGPKTQAQLITQAIKMLRRERVRLGIRGFVYYAWRDAPPYPGGKDFWGLHTGLLSKKGTAKPGLRAMTAALRPESR